MELKAVNEYETPDYITYDESKNKIFRLLMNCKKVSISVLAMVLLYNNVLAVPIEVLPHVVPGGLVYSVRIVEKMVSLYVCLELVSFVVIIMMLLYVMICNTKIKKISDEFDKNKLKKKKEIQIRTGIVIFLLIPILGTIVYFFANWLNYLEIFIGIVILTISYFLIKNLFISLILF